MSLVSSWKKTRSAWFKAPPLLLPFERSSFKSVLSWSKAPDKLESPPFDSFLAISSAILDWSLTRVSVWLAIFLLVVWKLYFQSSQSYHSPSCHYPTLNSSWPAFTSTISFRNPFTASANSSIFLANFPSSSSSELSETRDEVCAELSKADKIFSSKFVNFDCSSCFCFSVCEWKLSENKPRRSLNPTYVQQHRLDFADALVQAVEGSLDGLENPLVLLQGHQPLLHQFAQGPFARLMTFEFRVEQRIRMDQRKYRVADFLISEKTEKRFQKLSHHVHPSKSWRLKVSKSEIHLRLISRFKTESLETTPDSSLYPSLNGAWTCLVTKLPSNVCLCSQKNIDMWSFFVLPHRHSRILTMMGM